MIDAALRLQLEAGVDSVREIQEHLQEQKYRNKNTGTEIQEYRCRVRYRNRDSEEIQ